MGVWQIRNIIADNNGDAGQVYWTQVRKYMMMEQYILFGEITAGVLFLGMAYT